jgi:hypothetical protein
VAGQLNNLNILGYLIEKGANLDAQNENGETPLFMGRLQGRIKNKLFLFFINIFFKYAEQEILKRPNT